jgi:uncharacterized membrane protein YfcA
MNLGLILLGIGVGVMSGVFGIGGGIILVPALVFLFKFPHTTATAMSLSSMLLPVGILGVMRYYRDGKISLDNIYTAMFIAIGIFVGTYFGARIALMLPEVYLKKIFAVFLMLVAVRFWTQS